MQLVPLERLRREAHRLQLLRRIPYSVAVEIVAKSYGFESYASYLIQVARQDAKASVAAERSDARLAGIGNPWI